MLSVHALQVLTCVYLLTNDTGQGADEQETLTLLSERFSLSHEEAKRVLNTAIREGAVSFGDGPELP